VFNSEGAFTCPVKTFMIFYSMHEIDVNDEFFIQFNECYTSASIKEISEKENLQYKISKTNSKLYKKSKVYSRKQRNYEFIVFSNEIVGKILPMCWVCLDDEEIREFKMNLPPFVARYVVVKPID
jgi:hypothetical protein